MWLYLPDPDDTREPWVGTIAPPQVPGESWSFELIRHTGPGERYDVAALEGRLSVVALLDFQKKCTLIRPRVLNILPGTVGPRFPHQRTIISGEFDGLVTGLVVDDLAQPMFAGFSMDSPTFGLWYAPPAFKTDFDAITRTQSVTIPPTATTTLQIDGLGKVLCTTCAEVRDGGRDGTIHSAAYFRVEFDELVALDALADASFGLESLFGFLIGFRGPFPDVQVWLKETYKIGRSEMPLDGTLQLAGAKWLTREAPHRLRCLNRIGVGSADLQTVLTRFLADRDSLVSRIYAVEFCRHFSPSLNDRFAVAMPVLEDYLKRRYTEAEELNFLTAHDKFFAWVDSAPDPEIGEFSRKHVAVKNQKKPGLKTLLERAIGMVNAKGFAFPVEFAERLSKRRGKQFHTVPTYADGDGQAFYKETLALVGLLMLHTFDDLGVDIACLTGQWNVHELRLFLPGPDGTAAPAGNGDA